MEQASDEEPFDRAIASPIANELSTAIGQELQSVYQRLLTQPVPDRFTDLLAQLSDAEDDEAEKLDQSQTDAPSKTPGNPRDGQNDH